MFNPLDAIINVVKMMNQSGKFSPRDVEEFVSNAMQGDYENLMWWIHHQIDEINRRMISRVVLSTTCDVRIFISCNAMTTCDR